MSFLAGGLLDLIKPCGHTLARSMSRGQREQETVAEVEIALF